MTTLKVIPGRVSSEELDRIKQAAEAAGERPGNYVRKALGLPPLHYGAPPSNNRNPHGRPRKDETMTTYTTIGSVRGACGHTHHTLATAAACLDRDARGCRSQGGYSDRAIVAIEGGEQRPLTESEREQVYDMADA